MEERKERVEEFIDHISAWGNENITRNHIAYFEKKLDEEIAPVKEIKFQVSLSNFPNFAVWIRLYTEFISNKFFWRLFRAREDWRKIDRIKFKSIISEVEKMIKPSLIKNAIYKPENIRKASELVLELRHSFQHGGLPNLMRILNNKVDERTFTKMLDPKHYKRTKKIFSCADYFIELLPKPTKRF